VSEWVNPYIAGAPVAETKMFFGRADVFDWIEQNLTGRYADHILVVHGQRRVGKTSVLKQLHNRLPERYVPVFFDFQGRTHTTLDRFLWWLSREIVRVLKQDRGIVVPTPEQAAFSKDPDYLDSQFLPGLQPVLGEHTLLLTFDEFDNLEESEVKQALARPLVDYLRRLMGSAGLNFIFSIGSSGRKLENMQASYTEFFKAALYKKISFLGQENCFDLITQPVEGVLAYDLDAVNRIYAITSGHPYFTQLLCHELFSQCQRTEQRQVRESDVSNVLDDVVERGTVNLKFVWDDASDLEKWSLAALAQIEGKTDTRKLADYLRRQRVRFGEPDLNSALLHLREKDVLTADNRFVVYLLQVWLQKNRPLEQVREELTEVNPIANRYIEIGLEFKESRQYDQAIESFQQALAVDAANIQARVGVASTHLDQKAYDKAVAEFEKALTLDEEDIAARAGLCDAHLALGDQAISRGRTREAIQSYQQVLSINAEHTEARQRMSEIHRQRAEKALADGRDEDALTAFEDALRLTPEDQALTARYAQVREEKRARVLKNLLARAEKEQSAKNWDRAAALFEDALKLSPNDAHVKAKVGAVREAQRAARLAGIMSRADQAAAAERWNDAIAALNEYLALQPEDAAVQARLVQAQRENRENQLFGHKARARGMAALERWDEARAAWRDYLAMDPEDRERAQEEIKKVERAQEMAHAYAAAQAAMAKKDYDRAIHLFKGIILEEASYKSAARLMTQAIEANRTARRFGRKGWLVASIGALGVLIVVIGAVLLLQSNPPFGIALAPPATPFTLSPAVSPTNAPTQAPAAPVLVQSPSPRPTATLAPSDLVMSALRKAPTTYRVAFSMTLSASYLGVYNRSVFLDSTSEIDDKKAHSFVKSEGLTMPSTGPIVGLEFVLANGNQYVKGTRDAGWDPESWYATNVIPFSLVDLVRPDALAIDMRESQATEFVRIGSELLDGQSCEKVQYNPKRMPSQPWAVALTDFERELTSVIDRLDLVFWVCTDGFIHRYTVDQRGHSAQYSSSASETRIDARYSEMESAAIVVQLPAAGEVRPTPIPTATSAAPPASGRPAIPPGQGGLFAVSYCSREVNFDINGQLYKVTRTNPITIFLPPGKCTWSANVTGGRTKWSGSAEIKAGEWSEVPFSGSC